MSDNNEHDDDPTGDELSLREEYNKRKRAKQNVSEAH